MYDLHQVIPTTPNKKQIIGWEKDKSDQIWTRPYQLSDYQFLKLSHAEQEDIVEIENERCRNGAWFYNFGEPIFLTGDNYNFLTYYRMEGHIIPEFMQFQSATFYFYLMAELDAGIYGTLELKPRREGCTHRKLSIGLNRAIMNESFFVGIQSKTGKDAKEANFDNVVKAYGKLPCWRKPKTRLDNPSRELAFEQPPKRSSGKVKSILELEYEDYYLNSKIDWRATSSDAYDGDKLHVYILDEFWKAQEMNAYTALKTHKKCLVDGEDIVGIAYVLSTVGIDEKEETVSEEAFQTGKQIWNESSPYERNSLGETASGLLRMFIPAQSSRRGKSRLTGVELLDKYGNVNEGETKKVLFARRENELDPRERQKIIRQEPMNVQEAISSMMGDSSVFDNIRLGERLTFLDNYAPSFDDVQKGAKSTKYWEGNLAWANNERYTEVVRVDSKEPRWRIPYLPNIAGDDHFNRVKKLSTSAYTPFSDTPFVIGVDPFNISKPVDGKGSQGAFHVKHKYLNRYCCHYRYRPASPDLFNEDVLLTAWYYGARINPERSGSNIFDWFKRNGVYGFIMSRPDVTMNSTFTKKDTEKGTTATPDNVELGCNLTENYFAKPNEEKNENIVDNLEYFWDEITLIQLMEFNLKRREKYDCVMALFHTEIGAQAMKRFKMQPLEVNKDNNMSIVDILTPRFNSGKAILRAPEQNNRSLPMR